MIRKEAYSILQQDDDWEDVFSDKKKPELLPNQIISNGKTITLNEVQVAAVKAGEDFFKSEDLFFTLAGSAGTGKTTIAKEILRRCQLSVIVTAPTHKAKKVVSRATGYKAETLHKLLGMQPDMDVIEFTQQNLVFALKGTCMLDDYECLLIDEASMLNKYIVELVMSKCKASGCKCIFLGDPRQLPPVKEDIGKVFILPDVQKFMLTKVERQSFGNPLAELYTKILDHIDRVDWMNKEIKERDLTEEEIEEYNRIPFDYEDKFTEDGLGYKFFRNRVEFGAEIINNFKLGEDLNNRVIAWKNDTVQAFNGAIRRKLLGSLTAPPAVGDMLMGYRTVKDPDVWSRILFENSADYIITKIEKGYLPASNFDKTVKGDLQGFFITLQDLDSGYGCQEKLFFVDEQSKPLFAKIEQEYATFAKNSKNNRKWAWKTYYEFRDRFCIIGDIKNGRNQLVAKDFDFGYAITTYKSQGSTYDNSFVILSDILTNPDVAQRWRHAYVALSRSSKASFILI